MNIIKMTGNGQIVIPSDMRSNFKEGEELVLVEDKKRIILEKVESLSEKQKEDLEFSKRIKKAWKSYDKGEFTSYTKEEFLKRLEEW